MTNMASSRALAATATKNKAGDSIAFLNYDAVRGTTEQSITTQRDASGEMMEIEGGGGMGEDRQR